MHEAGHAAHFANIAQGSPLFSQERAPTSVAYAETQSMFLDSLVGDAAWRGRYARDREVPLYVYIYMYVYIYIYEYIYIHMDVRVQVLRIVHQVQVDD